MTETELRAMIYGALDQLDVYKLANIAEDILVEEKLDTKEILTCRQCDKIYGDCSGPHRPCEERFYQHYNLKK